LKILILIIVLINTCFAERIGISDSGASEISLKKDVVWLDDEKSLKFINLLAVAEPAKLDFTWLKPGIKLIRVNDEKEVSSFILMPWRAGGDLVLLPAKMKISDDNMLSVDRYLIGPNFEVIKMPRKSLEELFPLLVKYRYTE